MWVPANVIQHFLLITPIHSPFLMIVSWTDTRKSLEQLQVFVLDVTHLTFSVVKTPQQNVIWLLHLWFNFNERFHLNFLNPAEQNAVMLLNLAYALLIDLDCFSVVDCYAMGYWLVWFEQTIQPWMASLASFRNPQLMFTIALLPKLLL